MATEKKISYKRAKENEAIKRTNTFLTTSQLNEIKKIAEKNMCSENALISDALELFLLELKHDNYIAGDHPGEKTKFSCRFSESLYNRCSDVAKKNKVSLAQIQRDAVNYFIEKISNGKVAFYLPIDEKLTS